MSVTLSVGIEASRLPHVETDVLVAPFTGLLNQMSSAPAVGAGSVVVDPNLIADGTVSARDTRQISPVVLAGRMSVNEPSSAVCAVALPS